MKMSRKSQSLREDSTNWQSLKLVEPIAAMKKSTAPKTPLKPCWDPSRRNGGWRSEEIGVKSWGVPNGTHKTSPWTYGFTTSKCQSNNGNGMEMDGIHSKQTKNLGWLEVLTNTAGPNVSLFRFSETNPGGLGCCPVMMVNELPPKLCIASKWNIYIYVSFVTKGRVRFTRLWTRPMFHSNSYPWHRPFWYEYGKINSKSLTYFFQFIPSGELT